MNYTYLPYLLTKYNTACVLCMVNLLRILQHPDSKIGLNIVPCFHLHIPQPPWTPSSFHPPVRGSGMARIGQRNNPTCF